MKEIGRGLLGIDNDRFLNTLGLDENPTQEDKKKALTLQALEDYPFTCLLEFGKDIPEKFGGVKEVLKKSKHKEKIIHSITENFLEDNTLEKFAQKITHLSLSNFENKFPKDKTLRKALEVKEQFLEGKATEKDLLNVKKKVEKVRHKAWSKRSKVKTEQQEVEFHSAEMAVSSVLWSVGIDLDISQVLRWTACSIKVLDNKVSTEDIYKNFTEELLKLI